MQYPESPLRRPRGLVLVNKPERRSFRVDRIALWLSESRKIDGLWVGTMEGDPYPALRRVEEALQLIKRHDALNYARTTRHLDRIWVRAIPSAEAHYERSLNACVIDERYALQETMTIEKIASTIVHETTHARLEGWGIDYVERMRTRIEAICLRRELSFAARLPASVALREEIADTLEWCAANPDYLSDASFRERDDQGQIDTLRHLGAPDWLVGILTRLVRRQRLRAESRAP